MAQYMSLFTSAFARLLPCGLVRLGRFLRATSLLRKHAGEYLVYILQLTWQVEGIFDLLARDAAGDFFVGQHELVEVQAFFPGAHGVRLHEAISVLAGDAVFDQVEQQLPAEDQAARAFEIGAHAFGIDEHGVDEVGGLIQKIVDEGGGVGQDDALRRRVRDVALMPQRDVFESSLRVAADYARQSADLLAVTGLRLWGMADDPFCFSLKNSSASRTSVRCRWRISVAILSSVLAITASVPR